MHTRIFVVSNVRTFLRAIQNGVGTRMDGLLVPTIRISLAIGKERYIRLGR